MFKVTRNPKLAIIRVELDSKEQFEIPHDAIGNYLKMQQLTEVKWNRRILSNNQSFPLWSFVLAEVLLTEL